MAQQHRPDRRAFLAALAAGGTGAALGLPGGLLPAAAHGDEDHGPAGPYGELGEPDADGLRLPEGFSARVIARSGEVVAGTSYTWHAAPDGGAAVPTEDGGWVYVSNAELGRGDGGVGAIRFDESGEIVDAYRILDGTARNCSGGATPWSTWLSCEEFDVFGDGDVDTWIDGYSAGRVWECDPTGPGQGTPLPQLGVFSHEAVAVDYHDEKLYLTEDEPDGRLYRFTPEAYPSLDAGLLEVAVVEDGRVTWAEVPDPEATTAPTREQVPESTPFDGGEGIWYRTNHVYFTTKGDDHVWDLNVRLQSLSVLYDGAEDQPLHGVDNIVGTFNDVRDLYVVEDGDDLQCILLSEEGDVVPFLQLTGPLHEGSELTGPGFSPDGTRFYVSSQRGGDRGIGMTWEVTGPFRTQVAPPGAPTTTSPDGAGGPTTTAAPAGPTLVDGGTDGDSPTGLIVGVVGSGVVLAGAAAVALRRRGQRSTGDVGDAAGGTEEGSEAG